MQLPQISELFSRRLLVAPPILIGAVILYAVVSQRNTPKQVAIPESSRQLLVIEVPQVTAVPRVLGFGNARPGDIWTAVAEVKGRIIETHPELSAGSIVRQGELILIIDPTDTELQIAQLNAEVAQIQAQISELDTKKGNLNDSLAIENQSLSLIEKDLQRLEKLRSSNAVTESEYEQISRNVLSQQQSVQSLRSSLNLLPSQRQSLTASLDSRNAALGQAQLDLERTTIKAPFDCRLSDVSLEKGQFVAAGQTLFDAYGAATTEVEAQIPLDQLRKLLNPSSGPMNVTAEAMQAVRKVFNVQVIVRLRTGEFVTEWDGRFDRIREEIDPRTRTLRVVVVVDKPYENVIPGKRPPLAPGMFCEVELRGKPRQDQIVIPRTSVRDGSVYLVNNENRLERRAVKVAFQQGGFAVIESGISAGERLVVSDPTPAIEGMLVEPTVDRETRSLLISEAAGDAELR